MHHFPDKSGLVDSGKETRSNQQPLCPKPRRLGPVVPEFLKPLRCTKHSPMDIEDGRNRVLNMIAGKSVDKREFPCTGCSPVYYSGSPPGRTENPLVHDVQFHHQMELHSPFTRTKLSDKFDLTSTSPA
ncbi:hypothetical protein SLA2020_134900 [Shorea laevis]